MRAFLLTIFLLSNTLVFAQQFSTKTEALNWLKNTFEQKLVKSDVTRSNEEGDNFGSYFFDYDFTDSSLMIYRARRTQLAFYKIGFTNEIWYILPFNKIDKVEPSKVSAFFKNSSNVTFRSDCRCFKKGAETKSKKMDALKKVDINTYSDLIDAITIPFNLIDGEDIGSEIISAFKMLKEGNVNNNAVSKEKGKKQTLDSLKAANRQKHLAYLSIPHYDVLTADSSLIDLPEFLLKHRQNKDKPTLLVTWSYKWCTPCIRKIDTLLKLGTALNYNVILINRDAEVTKEEIERNPHTYIGFSDLKNALATHAPKYDEDALLLFDRLNQLDNFDNSEAPLWVWLDNNLNILGSYNSYDISISAIRSVLSKIEQGKIVNGDFRYYDSDGILCEQSQAKLKLKLIKNNNIITLSVYDIGKDIANFEIDYITNKKGKLFYQTLRIKE